ncbi:unnamed protein product, partial [Soboliphyme baturini]|uniref:PDZ domain-containing protein n=1 Tax=Soboliphyme baturini TaxID=241478 RepID=A0A183J022_9BILA
MALWFISSLYPRFEYNQPLANGTMRMYVCQTVELIKKPGQTLGVYLREGNGVDRESGVFVSRLIEGCDVEKSCVLKPGDEILSVNEVNVTRMSIDDVVVMISIPRRLVMKIKFEKDGCLGGGRGSDTRTPFGGRKEQTTAAVYDEKPVVLLKNMPRDESKESSFTDDGQPLASSQLVPTARTSLGLKARQQQEMASDASHTAKAVRFRTSASPIAAGHS